MPKVCDCGISSRHRVAESRARNTRASRTKSRTISEGVSSCGISLGTMAQQLRTDIALPQTNMEVSKLHRAPLKRISRKDVRWHVGKDVGHLGNKRSACSLRQEPRSRSFGERFLWGGKGHPHGIYRWTRPVTTGESELSRSCRLRLQGAGGRRSTGCSSRSVPAPVALSRSAAAWHPPSPELRTARETYPKFRNGAVPNPGQPTMWSRAPRNPERTHETYPRTIPDTSEHFRNPLATAPDLHQKV